MKKCGFTLAEVLITLGIVGVIAALTAPALVMNSRNEANAAKLSVTISNLENAFTTAIAQEGVDSLYGTRMWPAGNLTAGGGNAAAIARFAGRLGQYLHINGFKSESSATFYNGTGPYAMNANGGVDNEGGVQNDMDNCFIIELKNGAVVFMRTFENGDKNSKNDAAAQDAVINAGGSLLSDAADVFIDVNGKQGPNVYGRDIFDFYLGKNGILYPYGGLDVAIYEARDLTQGFSTWDSAGAKNGNKSCQTGNIQGGLGCTARLISEGYKMNY